MSSRLQPHAAPEAPADTLWIWRHPRPRAAEGRCIGRTDLPLDPRRARRLARQMHQAALRHGLPREVHTSPLQRCADVGRALARLGYRHRVDARLLELDFGRWDGLPWSRLSAADFAGWEADFEHHPPGGGEPVAALRARVLSFLQALPPGPALVVGHAGWINALRLVRQQEPLTAADWPRPPAYGQRLVIPNPCRSMPGLPADGGTPPPSPGSPRAA
ncbi:histidine phosphatase family protein [Aquincola sp. J276]|uniref:histidine phosphatase family protein n=1 Tax=Aquincola sp. J276 TaxID=2898432 RepID=UPI0021514CB8|nr:histidine phosphatase family protein [Aquincola sp. J276]MCR5864309.1 histidine phosphatase family protein [Aquincola sp. J276]